MKQTFNYQHPIDETAEKKHWRRVFFSWFAPQFTRLALWFALFCILEVCIPSSLRLSGYIIVFIIATTFVVNALLWPIRAWRKYRKMFWGTMEDDHPVIIRLAESFMEITHGDNVVRNDFRHLAGYLDLKDDIALVASKTIAAIFEKKGFEDGGVEFTKSLKLAGIKKRRLCNLGQWLMTFLLFVFVAWASSVGIHDNCLRRLENDKSSRRRCENRLKQLSHALYAQSFLYETNGLPEADEPFQLSMILKELLDNGNIDHEICSCRESHVDFIVVPYRRLLDGSSPDPANTPLILEGKIGAHRNKRSIWGKGVRQTLIAFEDGHVAIEENITSFMDIYNKYAPFMSKEDASALRACCDEADNNNRGFFAWLWH